MNVDSKSRIEWIDVCKGIGMVAVVLGHGVTATVTYVFLFHMPLFFFLSGYLYKHKAGYIYFAHRKARHLLIPYLSFLALFSVPVYAYYIFNSLRNSNYDLASQVTLFTFKIVHGGAILTNALGTFWFVTCLFLTQQIYAMLYGRIKSESVLYWIAIAAYLVAMLEYWYLPKLILPWAIEAIPMAFVFYTLGHLFALRRVSLEKFVPVTIAIAIAGLILHDRAGLDLSFSMKYHQYGTVIVNFLMAVSGTILTMYLAKIAANNGLASLVFMEIGAASMVILYLHQSFLFALNKVNIIPSDILESAIALLIPYLIYKFICKFALLRRFLLGELPKTA